MRLHIDYETRSPVDLQSAGVYAYAENPHTQAILLSWAIDKEDFQVWYILRGDPMPDRLRQALLDPEVTIVAHNAGFERVMSVVVGLRQGFLTRDVWEAMRNPNRWSCTAGRAAACGLPRALEKVCHALNLNNQKDMAGHKLMLEMCVPRGIDLEGRYIWLEDWPRMQRLGEYCIADGYAEREVDDYLPNLSEFEHQVWCTTERMNDRGVLVDDKLLMRLMGLVRETTNYLNTKISSLSRLQQTGQWCGIGSNNRECYSRDGASALTECGSCSHCGGWPADTGKTVDIPKITNPKKIVQWLLGYGIDVTNKGIGKWVIQGLLEDEDIPSIVREVLITRRDGGKSSTAKFITLMRRINTDYRVRGALLYAGAAATSRWSSRGVQLQNLPRNKLVKNAEKVITVVMNPETGIWEIEKLGPPMVIFSELARPMFIAPEGYWMARGDYSQIEARVNAWLAGEHKILQAFVDYDTILGYDAKGKPIRKGPDMYIMSAADIYGVAPSEIDAEDPRRQVGKVTILACGFGGGYKALLAMARIYGIKIEEGKAQEAVAAWRNANQNIKAFWYALDRAAISCMKGEPGEIHQAGGGIWFRRNEQCLAMRLPSGRHLVYWYPKLEMKVMPWTDDFGDPVEKEVVSYYGEDSQTHVWRRFHAWHGLWCENAVQATARDIMAAALVKMDARGMQPILTVHDEAVVQLSMAQYPQPQLAADAVKAVMLEPLDWTFGLPIEADASAGRRYVKAG